MKKPARKKPAKKTPKRDATPKKKIISKPVKKAARLRRSEAPASRRQAVRKPAAKPRRPAGVPEKLRDAALKVLDERQAEDIITVDLADRSSVADYLIIASGRASRQLAAIAHYLRETFAQHGISQIRVEGLPEANWVLVDAGDIIVHLFRPEVRRYYDLERIWDNRKK
jgi:ribosome-associated protein